MANLFYDELISWYRLLDPYEEHIKEANCYLTAFEKVTSSQSETLLDLGAGAGNNAFYLKNRFRCTLTDLSEKMLVLSRELNPECEHFQGDMRTLRLDRTFDVVLVHDAVMYLLSEEDLSAAIQTAFIHTNPGGATIFTPDSFQETFSENTHVITGEDKTRALRCMEWSWDPDPEDTIFTIDEAILLRENENVKVVYDQNLQGLFSKKTWMQILQNTGYQVEMIKRPIGDEQFDEVFLCKKPLS